MRFIKNKTGCLSYLMLKDIFPQNAVDLEIIKNSGLSRLIYNYYKKKELSLLDCSDIIGCMSPKNIDYVYNNYKLPYKKIELLPNSINVVDVSSKKIELYFAKKITYLLIQRY